VPTSLEEEEMMRQAKRVVSLLPAGALCLGLIGCGSDSPSAPTAVATPAPPPAPVQTIVAQGNSGGLEAGFLRVMPSFSIRAAGTLDVTVDWTLASNDVDVYLARGACSFQQFIADRCDIASFSESATSKPEKLNVANASAGAYTLLIGNHGPTAESISFQVMLTSVGARSQASAPAGSPARHRGFKGIVG
jgi:hypothetical protein